MISLFIKIRRYFFQLVFSIFRKFGYLVVKERKGFRYIPDLDDQVHGKIRDIREDTLFAKAAEIVRAPKPKRTLLDHGRLYYLYQGLKNVIKSSEKEAKLTIVEVGVYRGGVSYFWAYLSQIWAPGRVNIASIDTV